MKKILSFLAIAMIMMGLSACSGGGGSTPEGAVKNVLDAMKSADVKALSASCCDSQGHPIDISKDDPAKIKQMETFLKMFSELEYTIGTPDIDGNRAKVRVTVKLMGEENTSMVECIKCSDGKWRVYDADGLM